ncbi:hypothetical protein BKP37_09060 [Anaerobacillus alkalilacustris]|uniref:Uncharacterized protein n=1 Tax=Anaerobacillus alkalilacustris TaxID=393763 RepID=A0A1S2LP14_9BACI|nr:hypothetical protein [Anaerobacillus alkalilacustris]OIJ14221.1 hypothetical protein BKP37_09060 [Anaerobacillus alkalilacustris]
MNFPSKAQSINDYLDKMYDQLIKDSAFISDFETLQKKCNVETRKLSNYSIAILEEIKNEVTKASLTLDNNKNVIAELDGIHRNLAIRPFQLTKEECLYVEQAPVSNQVHPKQGKQERQGTFNKGTGVGAIVGLGVGFFIVKSPNPLLLVISTLSGALVGTIFRLASSKPPVNTPKELSASIEKPVQRFGKVNKEKFETVVRQRKAAIQTLFKQYIQQLEEACRRY